MLCDGLHELRQECAGFPDDRKALALIEMEAVARRPVLELFADLLDMRSEDVLEKQRGIATGLPGAGGGRADDEVFGCPDSGCDNRATTRPAGEPPWCALLGRHMRRL
jgi:hypothetical protein